MEYDNKLVGLRARHDDSLAVKEFRNHLIEKVASPSLATTSLTSAFTVGLTRLIATNAPRSAFNVMKANMIQVPLRTRVAVFGVTINASEVLEGESKLFRRITPSELDTETSKFAAAASVTSEFIKEAPELAGRVLADTLSEAVARAADIYFLGKLNAFGDAGEGDSTVDPTFAAMLDQLSELVRIVKTGESSKLFFILRPSALKYLSSKAYENGISTVKWDGGEVMGVKLIASDSQTNGTITLADASGILYGDDGIEVRRSDIAAVELNDAPTNKSSTSVAATSLVSGFQANFSTIIAEQRISVRVAGTSCVASLSGVQWGLGGGSPSNL